MPKVSIIWDERYPVFAYSLWAQGDYISEYRPVVEIPQETLERWGRVTDEYEVIQREMRNQVDNYEGDPQ